MQTPDWHGIFTRFYRQYAPSKATPEKIAKLLKKYDTKEMSLLNKLFTKYSIEPLQQLSFASPDVVKPRGRVFPGPPSWDSYTMASGGAAFWRDKDLVYLDVQFDGVEKKEGKIVIELFSAKVPRTCANFRALCTGELRSKDPALSYEGNAFHRIISGFMCQAGDTTVGNGTGGRSIYGKKFDDESAGLAMEHHAGTLSMANSGPNTNGSQFFFLLDAKPHLNGKHCVFGKVVAGMDVVYALGEVQVGEGSRPTEDARILSCGAV
jgi:cyclophilin family peptidyl-prolyl cis-trans isomerase